jgi:hypothetical protein
VRLIVLFARAIRETGTTYTLDDLNQRLRALLQLLEDSGISH